jgi:hypothetical protein
VSTILTETRERFLLAIAREIPPDRIAEIHFFQPIRQGGVESGVAVVAARRPGVVEPVVQGELIGVVAVAQAELDADMADPPLGVHDADALPDGSAPGDADGDAAPEGSAVGENLSVDAGADGEADGIEADDIEADDIEAGDEPVTATSAGELDADVVAASVAGGAQAAVVAPVVVAAPPRRYTVFTAHYRLVLKGPDRGKWESGVTEEADAPLVTVETVVRGVLRRAGDEQEPSRMEGPEAAVLVAAVEARRQAAPATQSRR